MNNKNKILVGCLALLLVLSVGYALFGETVTINGTATAKGDFNITTTCQMGLADVSGLNFFATESGMLAGPTQENSFSGGSCNVEGDNIIFTTNLNAPGAMRYYTVKATNTGSIPALAPVSGGTTTTQACMGNSMSEILDYDSTKCRTRLFDAEDDMIGPNHSSINFESISFAYIIEKKDGTLVNLFELEEEEAMSYLNEDGEKVKLDAGDSIYYVGKMYIPADYEWYNPSIHLKTLNMIDFDLTANYTLDFVQQTN